MLRFCQQILQKDPLNYVWGYPSNKADFPPSEETQHWWQARLQWNSKKKNFIRIPEPKRNYYWALKKPAHFPEHCIQMGLVILKHSHNLNERCMWKPIPARSETQVRSECVQRPRVNLEQAPPLIIDVLTEAEQSESQAIPDWVLQVHTALLQ